MDWIDEFMSYTDGLPTSETFRLWAAISALSGALERRCWAITAGQALYPNLFVMLVAQPGIGKTVVINPVVQLWRSTQFLRVAPKALSRASFIDALTRSGKRIPSADGKSLMEYYCLMVANAEMGVLISKHDLDFLANLNDLYDNPDVYDEEKRTKEIQIEMINPSINVLLGAQPAFLSSLLPDEAWGMGTMSRMIMVHEGEETPPDLFGEFGDRSLLFKSLSKQMVLLTKLSGQFMWDKGAQDMVQNWQRARLEPTPTHSKLFGYNSRRMVHMLKLAMVSAVARGPHLVITASDIARAKGWLFAAEAKMPQVFREMVHKNDSLIIQEFHIWLYGLWISRKRQPVHSSVLWNYLHERAPTNAIGRIMEVCEKAQVIRRVGPELYEPRPRIVHGTTEREAGG